MQLNEIQYFLDKMFTNPEEFKSVHGLNNAINAKYMLVADVISEHSEALAYLLKDQLNKTIKPIATTTLTSTKSPKTSF